MREEKEEEVEEEEWENLDIQRWEVNKISEQQI